ncbi:pyrroline-5-carboxylate reductase [Rubidibacter lacunae KORDI 51-2]|uniref:Pyrroline-5-carboxylate reductase n=1 Tax=Rubidibacter lacunae KORDI 51-2 TaxID=582515 RepID=U5DKG7_9CHRO|nr:pyrroline-5-carboxylate reductase [Rubidibacter lacunae]ERN40195.1 pyrroline-5-carboxylate reductase [Rubidibacter lacunae KORDI 51-2]
MATIFGIVGGGVMGEALLSRLLALGVYEPDRILVSDPSIERRQHLHQLYHVSTTTDNRQLWCKSDIVLMAVKPQVFARVVAELTLGESNADAPAATPLVLSILAGTPLERLEAALPGCPVVRAMPNTNAIVGASITSIAPGSLVQSDHVAIARTIFSAVGEVVEVPEVLLDAVTGVSGSGPAYVAIAIEALADGGVAAGLPRAIAQQLAVQTVLGTAKQLAETGLHPGQLKDRVSSPGGTTIAAVAELERAGFRSALIRAVRSAYERARALGRD